MRTSDKGLKFIATWEAAKGPDLKPYLCSAKVPTIGYGNTFYPNGKKVTLKDPPITKEKAWEMFLFVIALFERDVLSLLGNCKVSQNQFDMLISFAYNVGTDIDQDDIPEGLGDSTLLKLIKANPSDPRIAAEFVKWNRGNGKVVDGLTNRRKAEAEIYFKK